MKPPTLRPPRNVASMLAAGLIPRPRPSGVNPAVKVAVSDRSIEAPMLKIQKVMLGSVMCGWALASCSLMPAVPE